MAEAAAQLFLALLADGCPLEDLKKMNLEGFDWNRRTETGKTLLVFAIERALLRNPDYFKDALGCIEWLISSGASIVQECSAGKSAICRAADEENTSVEIKCKGLNAISYVTEWQKKLKEADVWESECDFLSEVLRCFATPIQPRVSIHEGIAELWEKFLAAKASHDLTIEAADGLVTAHAHMLKVASPVVAAMLESPMKEGKEQRIEIKDAPSGAVSLFLEILYTCSAQNEPDYQTALRALDLAHRWQVDVVVAVLSELLAGMIADQSFAEIAEHAVLKGLERLKAAAKQFGHGSAKVKADLKRGRLPAAVRQLFPAPLKPSKPNEPKPKRRRM